MAQADTVATAVSPNSRRGKRRPPSKSLQATVALADMADVVLAGKCDPNSVEWSFLPTFAAFSLAADGSQPKVKDSSSSYIDLKTGAHETGIAAGRCYRVYL